jgi:hypothetical protein
VCLDARASISGSRELADRHGVNAGSRGELDPGIGEPCRGELAHAGTHALNPPQVRRQLADVERQIHGQYDLDPAQRVTQRRRQLGRFAAQVSRRIGAAAPAQLGRLQVTGLDHLQARINGGQRREVGVEQLTRAHLPVSGIQDADDDGRVLGLGHGEPPASKQTH